MADVDQVEAAVGEDDPPAGGALGLAPGDRLAARDDETARPGHFTIRSSMERPWAISSRLTVAVPDFMTTMPPAIDARTAASR